MKFLNFSIFHKLLPISKALGVGREQEMLKIINNVLCKLLYCDRDLPPQIEEFFELIAAFPAEQELSLSTIEASFALIGISSETLQEVAMAIRASVLVLNMGHSHLVKVMGRSLVRMILCSPQRPLFLIELLLHILPSPSFFFLSSPAATPKFGVFADIPKDAMSYRKGIVSACEAVQISEWDNLLEQACFMNHWRLICSLCLLCSDEKAQEP